MFSIRPRAWLALTVVLLTLSGSAGWTQDPSLLQVQPIVFRKVGAQLNMRVEVRNVGTDTVRVPSQIRILARRNRSEDWHLLRSWDIDKVPGGQIVARDYLPVPPLDPSLRTRHPLVRAEVWANNQLVSFSEATTGHSEAP
jgi:hypothetical protein